ncbi:MAG: hypothetical protein JWR16_3044 [Nevskia sp.]|nr:hypothetical protein [Nevskia sp.]
MEIGAGLRHEQMGKLGRAVAGRRWQWLIAAAVVLGGATAAADPTASTQLLYRWVDTQGHVHFSDRVPPEAVHQQYSEVDGKGRTRKLIEREKTPEEAAAAARSAKLAEQQASYDRYLLQTYARADDLELARAAQLQSLEQRSAAARKALADNQATLSDLRSRSVSAAAEGPAASAALQRQIKSFETSGAQTTDLLRKLDSERGTSAARFDADVQRYQLLTSAQPATH